jgi:hypothetical protein
MKGAKGEEMSDEVREYNRWVSENWRGGRIVL